MGKILPRFKSVYESIWNGSGKLHLRDYQKDGPGRAFDNASRKYATKKGRLCCLLLKRTQRDMSHDRDSDWRLETSNTPAEHVWGLCFALRVAQE